MDRFSSWLTIALLVDKRSATVIDALLLHVVWKLGYFSELTIDSEKGFQSAAFDAWAESMGIRVRQPLAYSPTGNASGEVGWKHIVTSDVRFPPTQQRLNEITFAWNTQTKASTQMVTQPPLSHSVPRKDGHTASHSRIHSAGCATQGWSHSPSLFTHTPHQRIASAWCTRRCGCWVLELTPPDGSAGGCGLTASAV